MIKFFKGWLCCLGVFGLGFDSSSSSSSSSSSTTITKNLDMRVVGGDGAANTSTYIEAGGSVNMSDHGAVAAAFGFARDAQRDAVNLATASQIDASRTMTDALEGVTEAYRDAKQGEQRILVGAAVAMVAVVAFAAVKGK